jgi:hypothetical protein
MIVLMVTASKCRAQQVVTPGVRVAGTADNPETLKFDLRSYVYNGQVQWTAARVH